MAVRSVSLCSGIEGLGIGVELAFEFLFGQTPEPVLYVERESYAASVLVSRMAEGSLAQAPIWSDLTTMLRGSCGAYLAQASADLWFGGIPCQPWSVAGEQKGTDDDRDLWPYVRSAVEKLAPRALFLENVPGFVVWDGLGRVARDLQEMGYRVAAILLSASDVGASHGRKRLFVMAHREGGERWIREPEGRGDSDASGSRSVLGNAKGGNQRGSAMPRVDRERFADRRSSGDVDDTPSDESSGVDGNGRREESEAGSGDEGRRVSIRGQSQHRHPGGDMVHAECPEWRPEVPGHRGEQGKDREGEETGRPRESGWSLDLGHCTVCGNPMQTVDLRDDICRVCVRELADSRRQRDHEDQQEPQRGINDSSSLSITRPAMAHPQGLGWKEGNGTDASRVKSGFSGPKERGPHMVDATRNGRREGWTESDLRSGRGSLASASLPLFAPGPADPRWADILLLDPRTAPAIPTNQILAGFETRFKPDLRRMADVVASAMVMRGHRLRAIGNGVVPLQAAVGFVLTHLALTGAE